MKANHPDQPNPLGSDAVAIWGFLLHLNGRVDTLWVGLVAILLGVIASLVTGIIAILT